MFERGDTTPCDGIGDRADEEAVAVVDGGTTPDTHNWTSVRHTCDDASATCGQWQSTSSESCPASNARSCKNDSSHVDSRVNLDICQLVANSLFARMAGFRRHTRTRTALSASSAFVTKVIVAMGPWSCVAEDWFGIPIPMQARTPSSTGDGVVVAAS